MLFRSVFVRAGTPRPIVDRLSTDIRRVMAEPSMTEWLNGVMTVTSPLTPEEFQARIADEVRRFGALIQKANIRLE